MVFPGGPLKGGQEKAPRNEKGIGNIFHFDYVEFQVDFLIYKEWHECNSNSL